MRIQAGRELDRQREVLVESWDGFGHKDMPAQRLDRQVDVGELRDLGRPRAGRVHDRARSDLFVFRAHSADPTLRA